jgi:hypothetical protein
MIQDHVGTLDHLPSVTVPYRTNQQIQIKDSTQSFNKFSVEITNSQQQHVTILKKIKTEHLRITLCVLRQMTLRMGFQNAHRRKNNESESWEFVIR